MSCSEVERKKALHKPIFSPLYALIDGRVDKMTGCVGVALNPFKTPNHLLSF